MARPAHLHIFGFPVRFELWFFLVVGFIAFTASARIEYTIGWIAIITASVLIHELGHAFAYRYYGATPSISMHGFGGLTFGHNSDHLSTGQRIVVSAAGSATTMLLLGGPAWVALRLLDPVGDARLILDWIFWINLIWALINLAPVWPLDGGHIVDDGLLLISGKSRRRFVHWISLVAAAAIAVFFWFQGSTFAVIIFGFMAYINIGQLGLVGGGSRTDSVDSVLAPSPPPTPPDHVRGVHPDSENDTEPDTENDPDPDPSPGR